MELRIIADLPPVPGNPRNSEGSFLPLKDGTVLFVYSHFLQSRADDGAAALWALRLKGDKIVEGPHEILPSGEDGAENLMSVSLLRMANGDVGLFYLRRQGKTLLEMVLRRSGDEGVTWSDPVPVTDRDGFFVANNDRVTRLRNGKILIPFAEHKKFIRRDGSVFFDGRAEAVFFCSEDDGRSFYELPGKGVIPYASVCRSGMQEPGILETAEGLIWCWARTDLGQQWEMISWDGGANWTPPAPGRFTSPLSPMSVIALKDGRIAAFYNPVPKYDGRPVLCDNGGRTPLVIRFSDDGGRNWGEPVILEDDPMSGYCYTALLEDEPGRLLMAYCAGNAGDGNCLARLRIARLAL